jgi:hypothetical protein
MDSRSYHMHDLGWNSCVDMAHQHGYEYKLYMTEEIQVWIMTPSLRGSVGYLQLQAVILQNKLQ